jgi:hypothetical protein
MTPRCPDREEWLSLLDGEATENRAALLRAHAEVCPRCAEALAQEERLVRDLAAPVPVSADGVQTVMRRLEQAEPRARRRAWRPWTLAVGGLAAAAALVVVAVRPAPRDGGSFAARGKPVPWSKKVGAELFALEPTPHRLQAGATLTPSTPLVAGYHNVDASAAYLMVFALDAQGETHWLYPGFTDAHEDPAALRLEPQQLQKLLPDSVMLDELPAGSLELITLIAREPLKVSQIESRPPIERGPVALRVRFPGARIESIALRVVPSPAKGPP